MIDWLADPPDATEASSAMPPDPSDPLDPAEWLAARLDVLEDGLTARLEALAARLDALDDALEEVLAARLEKRNFSVGRCLHCGASFIGTVRRQYCSDSHRKAAQRHRRAMGE